MNTKLSIDDVLKEETFSNLSFDNALIIYDGNINITKKIINSNIKNSILYPSYAFLGINIYLLSNRPDLELSLVNDDDYYINKQDEFSKVIIINDLELFYNLRNKYKNLEFIEL